MAPTSVGHLLLNLKHFITLYVLHYQRWQSTRQCCMSANLEHRKPLLCRVEEKIDLID